MTDSPHHECLAIDGGGTRCRFALSLGGNAHILEGGKANVSTDLDASVATIHAGISELADRVGRTPEELSLYPSFVGLAGVTGPSLVEQLTAALPFKKVRYADDRPAALRAALGQSDGVVAHCGTGSFLAAQLQGKMRLAGGWGPVLGDEASAQWMGRRLLWAVLQGVDGFRPCTPLDETVLDRFADAAGIVRFASDATPSDFGNLAPLVTAASRAQDPLAHALLQDGADLLAAQLPQMGWEPGLAICLTGGIGPHYGRYLPDAMQGDIRAPEAEPIHGALALATDFARELSS